MAQLGSAPGLGPGGRWFESSRSDQNNAEGFQHSRSPFFLPVVLPFAAFGLLPRVPIPAAPLPSPAPPRTHLPLFPLLQGTPKEFAENTAEQLGIDSTAPQKRKGIISSIVALVTAITAFVICATAKVGKVPDGAIGQADAQTNIQVEGALSFDLTQIVFLIGIVAAVIAVIQIVKTIRKNRR